MTKCPKCESVNVDMVGREHRKCRRDKSFPIGVWYIYVYHFACDDCGHKWEEK